MYLNNFAAPAQQLTWQDYDRHGLNDLTRFDEKNVGHCIDNVKEIKKIFFDEEPMQLINDLAFGLVSVITPSFSKAWTTYQDGLMKNITPTTTKTITSGVSKGVSSLSSGMGRGKKKADLLEKIKPVGRKFSQCEDDGMNRHGDFSCEDCEDEKLYSTKTGESICKSIKRTDCLDDGAAARPSWPFIRYFSSAGPTFTRKKA